MIAALDGATLGYPGRPVLRDVRFALARGERVVLLGRSGAGKSTLLRAVHDAAAAGRRVALVPQDHGLVPQLSVARNIYMGRLDDHGAAVNLLRLVWLGRLARAEIALWAQRVGLDGLEARPVERLSGGQRQRTALARALYRGGEAVIADEPVSAVDAVQARAIMDTVAARFDTALVALHDVDLARRFATRITGLRDGRIVFDLPPAELTPARIEALYA